MTRANDPVAGPRSGATVDAELDALFRGPRALFVTERNAAAKRLLAQGDAEAAQRLRALTKPSVSAWAVNQLWWTARPEVEALLDASRRMAGAMREGPAAQAAAAQARRRALEVLERTACAVLADAGHNTGMGMVRRVMTTLEALATHGVLGDGPQPGRLTADLEPLGFERLAELGAVKVDAPATSETETELEPSEADTTAQARAVAEREREQAAASERVKAAAQALDEATRVADEAVLEAQRTGLLHEQAHALAEMARQRAEEAERLALRARAQARRERERVSEARRVLAGRTSELDRHDTALRQARQRLAARASKG